jgi:hypothetical protein
MRSLALGLIAALVTAAACATAAFGGDIVTVPTANQLKQGEVDLAYYHIELDFPKPMSQAVRVQTLFVGITDNLELDAHHYDVDKGSNNTIWITTYKLLDESLFTPDLVVGARDVTRELGKTSYFVSAAKTLNPPKVGPALLPVVRGHLSVGTADDTLLGETRHDGFFGGIQIVLRAEPEVGLIALHDGQDLITGITFTPGPNLPTLKAGTFGDHWWVGISYGIKPPVK